MPSPHVDARLVKLAVTIRLSLPAIDIAVADTYDLLLDVTPQATVEELITAVVQHLKLPANGQYGLLRRLTTPALGDGPSSVEGYLAPELLLAECGLYDGVTLWLCDRTVRLAPELPIDVAREQHDLFLVDERGTHRGRITRLPSGADVVLGTNPHGEHRLVIDDREFPSVVMLLTNHNGQYVSCRIEAEDGVYVSGTVAAKGSEQDLLPGGTISLRRDGTDYVSFSLTTLDGIEHRSPIGKIRFDPAAKLADPRYPGLAEMMSRIDAAPSLPESQPFPYEQIIVPLAIVAALWIATGSALTLIISPIAAAIPIVNYVRQQRLAEQRYMEAREKWVRKLEDVSDELSSVVGVEEANLAQENPSLETWTRRAFRRLAGLWGRSPEQESFLRVLLGYGQLPSRYVVKLADGVDIEDDDFKRIMVVSGRVVDREAVRPQLFDVPVTVSLREHQLGIIGSSELVGHVATSVLLQAVCGQAPGALGLAALLPESEYVLRTYDWLKWLPHTIAGSTILPSSRVFTGRRSGNELLEELRELHQERRRYRLNELDETFALLVVHEAAEVDVALLAEVCELANGQLRVLWLGSSADTAPHFLTSVVQLHEKSDDPAGSTGVLLSGDPNLLDVPFALSLYRAQPLQTARALAALYDPRASGANAGIPAVVSLGSIVPLDSPASYLLPREFLGKRLPARVGVSQSGVFALDLVRDGPHVLIGGTTGSGKSELLQTLICSLIEGYAPSEVTLFLVDFKGGATFAPFRNLPHVVGYVSDLDQRNVDRALAFLRAELKRREEQFLAMDNAKEYQQYLSRALKAGRPDVLPRLVVVFDEFATIVQEFERSTMPAVIDVAQRGRSWGVHLVLATQQPTRDVVVPKVRSNVNARIALRTLSGDDSAIIIDRPDAARIPKALPGRAIASVEGNQLIEFQSGFSGADYAEGGLVDPVTIVPFHLTSVTTAAVNRAPAADADPHTHMEKLLEGVTQLQLQASSGAVALPPPLEDQPMREPRRPRSGRRSPVSVPHVPPPVEVGLVDLPRKQTQQPAIVRLEDGGFWVYGPNRSGRTRTLATVIRGFLRALPEGNACSIVCIEDRTSASAALQFDEKCIVSVPITNAEPVTRVIDQLWLLLRSRMTDDPFLGAGIKYTGNSPVLLTIDGYDLLSRLLNQPSHAQWLGRMHDILNSGRRYGVYACIAGRNRADLDLPAQSSMSQVYELHGHYADTPIAVDERLPGFALDVTGNLTHFYSEADGTDASLIQGSVDTALTEFLDPAGWRRGRVGTPDSHTTVSLGIDELRRGAFQVDLREGHILIVGPSRSGRTTLLNALADQICIGPRARAVALVDPKGGAGGRSVRPLSFDDVKLLHSAAGHEERLEVADTLGIVVLPDGRPVVFVDDCQVIHAHEYGSTLESMLVSMLETSTIQIVAVTTVAATTRSTIASSLRLSGVTVYTKPSGVTSDMDDGWRVRTVSFKHRPGIVYQRGDAIVQTDSDQHTIHLHAGWVP